MPLVSKSGLTTANYLAFVLHLIVGVIVAAWFFSINDKDPSAVPTALYDAVPCGKMGAAACPKRVTQDDSNLLIILMLVFIFFTAFMHLGYAVFKNWYHGMIDSQNNWMRWVEYAISATVLFVVIAISSGTKEFNVVLLFIFAMVAVMITGDAVEKVIRTPEGRKSSAQWPATAAAWIMFIGILVVFGRGYQAAKDNSGQDLPSFVDYVLSLTIIFFASFGVVQFLHVSGVYKSYTGVEATYIVLSFVSKMVLALIISSGITARVSANGT